MFKDKVIIVTGGTKGIGRSIVLEFLSQGARVITVYASDDVAAGKMKEGLSLDEQGRFFLYRGSIEDLNFIRILFQNIEAKFGQLNILVNNAGVNQDRLFLDMEESDWNKVITTNIKGTFHMSLLAADLMKRSVQPSHIVNIASISGIFGRAGQANYACSKGAVMGMTKLLAKRFARDDIFVNAIVPGLIRTDMAERMPLEKIEEITHATVLKRMGDPEEVAKVVLFLASGGFSYVSGACFKVDGGYLK